MNKIFRYFFISSNSSLSFLLCFIRFFIDIEGIVGSTIHSIPIWSGLKINIPFPYHAGSCSNPFMQKSDKIGLAIADRPRPWASVREMHPWQITTDPGTHHQPGYCSCTIHALKLFVPVLPPWRFSPKYPLPVMPSLIENLSLHSWLRWAGYFLQFLDWKWHALFIFNTIDKIRFDVFAVIGECGIGSSHFHYSKIQPEPSK